MKKLLYAIILFAGLFAPSLAAAAAPAKQKAEQTPLEKLGYFIETGSIDCTNIAQAVQLHIELSAQYHAMAQISMRRMRDGFLNKQPSEQQKEQMEDDISDALDLMDDIQFTLSDTADLITAQLPSCLKPQPK